MYPVRLHPRFRDGEATGSIVPVSSFPRMDGSPGFQEALNRALAGEEKAHEFDASPLLDASQDACKPGPFAAAPYQVLIQALADPRHGYNLLLWASAGSGKTFIAHGCITAALDSGLVGPGSHQKVAFVMLQKKGEKQNLFKEARKEISLVHPLVRRAATDHPEGDFDAVEQDLRKIGVYFGIASKVSQSAADYARGKRNPDRTNVGQMLGACMYEKRAYVVVDEFHEAFDIPAEGRASTAAGSEEFYRGPFTDLAGKPGNQVIGMTATPTLGGLTTLGMIFNALRRCGEPFPGLPLKTPPKDSAARPAFDQARKKATDAWAVLLQDMPALVSRIEASCLGVVAIDAERRRDGAFAQFSQEVVAVEATKTLTQKVLQGHFGKTKLTDLDRIQSGFGSELHTTPHYVNSKMREARDKKAFLEEHAPKVVALSANLKDLAGMQFVWLGTPAQAETVGKMLAVLGWEYVSPEQVEAWLRGGQLPGRNFRRVVAASRLSEKTEALFEKRLAEERNRLGEDIRIVVHHMNTSKDYRNMQGVHALRLPRDIGSMNQLWHRALRFRSHCDLEPAQRKVRLFVYLLFARKDREAKINRTMFGDIAIAAKALERYQHEAAALGALAQAALAKPFMKGLLPGPAGPLVALRKTIAEVLDGTEGDTVVAADMSAIAAGSEARAGGVLSWDNVVALREQLPEVPDADDQPGTWLAGLTMALAGLVWFAGKEK